MSPATERRGQYRRVEDKSLLDLHVRHHLLESIVEGTPDAVFVKDLMGRYVVINKAGAERFGMTQDQILNRRDDELFPLETAQRIMQMDQEIIHSLQTQQLVESLMFGRQERMASTMKAPWRDEQGRVLGVMGISRDVTARMRSEEALRESQKRLEKQAQQLIQTNHELERFTAVASHDLQEPLRKIMHFAQLLSDRYGKRLDAEGLQHIEELIDSAEHATQMVVGLLSYARAGRPVVERETVSMNEIVHQVLSDLEPRLKETHARVAFDPLPAVKGNELLIYQLMQNLLTNALKFSKSKKPEIHISSQRQNGNWVLSVRDNGIGIAAKDAERIFNAFERLPAAASFPGTGMGLATCKRIVEQQGGKIWVESELGKGSTFYFTLAAG